MKFIKFTILFICIILSLLLVFNYASTISYNGITTKITAISNSVKANISPTWSNKYPVHKNIYATMFWVGEKGTEENDNIPNKMSAWDVHWSDHFGGTDDPNNRDEYYPKDFTPKENPFYFALPYNDFGFYEKKVSAKKIPWYDEDTKKNDSSLKNRWIRVAYKNTVCYGQWEDVGPFEEDDFDYVFLNKQPKNKRAGIDLSPALRDCIHMDNNDILSWQFVDEEDVPDGPWQNITTSSGVSWK